MVIFPQFRTTHKGIHQVFCAGGKKTIASWWNAMERQANLRDYDSAELLRYKSKSVHQTSSKHICVVMWLASPDWLKLFLSSNESTAHRFQRHRGSSEVSPNISLPWRWLSHRNSNVGMQGLVQCHVEGKGSGMLAQLWVKPCALGVWGWLLSILQPQWRFIFWTAGWKIPLKSSKSIRLTLIINIHQ